MSDIKIVKKGITNMDVDCVVNAANEGLWAGGGVCGAIFNAAGMSELKKACNKLGGCHTGMAVITPGFKLKAKYIIHAVGPMWKDGRHKEPQLLYSAYKESLNLAAENSCRSIAFPLISAGIYGYPIDKAWRKALQACKDWINNHPDTEMTIYFAIIDDNVLELGKSTMLDMGHRSQGI